jgi:hypothetical protein
LLQAPAPPVTLVTLVGRLYPACYKRRLYCACNKGRTSDLHACSKQGTIYRPQSIYSVCIWGAAGALDAAPAPIAAPAPPAPTPVPAPALPEGGYAAAFGAALAAVAARAAAAAAADQGA